MVVLMCQLPDKAALSKPLLCPISYDYLLAPIFLRTFLRKGAYTWKRIGIRDRVVWVIDQNRLIPHYFPFTDSFLLTNDLETSLIYSCSFGSGSFF